MGLIDGLKGRLAERRAVVDRQRAERAELTPRTETASSPVFAGVKAVGGWVAKPFEPKPRVVADTPAAPTPAVSKPAITREQSSAALASLNELEGALNVFKAANATKANFDRMIATSNATAVAGALAGVLGAAMGAGVNERGYGGTGFAVAGGAADAGESLANSPAYLQAQDRALQSQARVNQALGNSVSALGNLDPELGLKLSEAMAKQTPAAFEQLRTRQLPALRNEIAHYPIKP